MRRTWCAVALATVVLAACGASGSPSPVDTTSRAVPSLPAVAVRLDVEPAVDEAARDLGHDVAELSRQAVLSAAARLPRRDADISVTISEDPNSRFIIGHMGLGAQAGAPWSDAAG